MSVWYNIMLVSTYECMQPLISSFSIAELITLCKLKFSVPELSGLPQLHNIEVICTGVFMCLYTFSSLYKLVIV